MKKLVTLFLAAGMLLTSVVGASAIEFKPSGSISTGFFASGTILGDHGSFQDHDSMANNWDDPEALPSPITTNYEPVRTRFRLAYALNLDFIANEQLSGRIGLKGNNKNFGTAAFGGSEFFVNNLYMDWYIPNTPVQVRMGRWDQGVTSWAGAVDLLALADGVRLSAKINDNVTVTALWQRRTDSRKDGVESYRGNAVDQFFVEVPLTFDGFLANLNLTYIRDQREGDFTGKDPVNAWAVPFNVARQATWNGTAYASDAPATSFWRHSRVWAVGGGFSLSKFSPFVFAVGFSYSSLKVDDVVFDITTGPGGQNAPNAFDRKGWYLSGRLSYQTAWGTPALYGWFTTGDDDNLANGSERPLAAAGAATGSFAMFGSTRLVDPKQCANAGFTQPGTWGLSAQWGGISFVDDLTHSVALTYVRGTNDPFMARFQDAFDANAVKPNLIPQPHEYMTTKDSAIALEVGTSYRIYRELTMAFDMFYVWQNFDTATWSKIVGTTGPDTLQNRLSNNNEIEFSNAWGIGLSFHYAF